MAHILSNMSSWLMLISIICFTDYLVECRVPLFTAVPGKKLWLQCSSDNISDIDTIYFIKIYKNVSTVAKEIVRISLITGTTDFTTKWNDDNTENKSSTNGSCISPPTNAQLVLHIDIDKLTCSDCGTYRCEISGLTTTNKQFKSTKTIEKDINECPCKEALRSKAGTPNSLSYFCIMVIFSIVACFFDL